MGFPFLHNYILRKDVIFPISDLNRTDCFKHINSIHFDCTGLLYHLSYGLPTSTILKDDSILLNILSESIYQYVEILTILPKINRSQTFDNRVMVHLYFDGQSPIQKKCLQRVREEKIKKHIQNSIVRSKELRGISCILDKSQRNLKIYNIALGIKNKIVQCQKFSLWLKGCEVSLPDEDGEADLKIVRTINAQKTFRNIYPAIVTFDTDIFISLESLRYHYNNLVVLITFPRLGQYCLTTFDLNNWIKKNLISYKVLIFYFLFFFGSDFEIAIASGTNKQIEQLFSFLKTNNFKVNSKLIIKCWKMLNIRSSNMVKITNLSLELLKKIVRIKKKSVIHSMLYYIQCKEFKNSHITLLSVYDDWKLLIKNISSNHIKQILNV